MNSGVDITKLDAGTQLVVETAFCLYTIEIVDPEPSEIMIVGGSTFINPSKAYLQASCDNEQTKNKWIQKNMAMIIRYKDEKSKKYRTVETDTVEQIKIIGPDNKWSCNI